MFMKLSCTPAFVPWMSLVLAWAASFVKDAAENMLHSIYQWLIDYSPDYRKK